jgi:hypothetical protein
MNERNRRSDRPDSEGGFSPDDHMAIVLSEDIFSHSPKGQKGNDVEINSVSPFDADHEMEIAASSVGSSQPD